MAQYKQKRPNAKIRFALFREEGSELSGRNSRGLYSKSSGCGAASRVGGSEPTTKQNCFIGKKKAFEVEGDLKLSLSQFLDSFFFAFFFSFLVSFLLPSCEKKPKKTVIIMWRTRNLFALYQWETRKKNPIVFWSNMFKARKHAAETRCWKIETWWRLRIE